ncbi:MAG: hypothetical protein GWO20_15850 [Candidatus Korarchaeota archaeon]|nr:hypothetical protein [Candidatus Korarchaeota archaeon]NIU84945.1 hypothetical protein [Candidatus Thorarchaeota archaeon]NIW14962.1 hypothetical protein [Candidatus Thorarchaeota archaeon]NIW52929.1 hypothetical protein [Candidatus Korarchaeota archaeon]
MDEASANTSEKAEWWKRYLVTTSIGVVGLAIVIFGLWYFGFHQPLQVLSALLVAEILLLPLGLGFGYLIQHRERKLVGKVAYPLAGGFLAGLFAMIGAMVLYFIAPSLAPANNENISATVTMLIMFGIIPLIGGVFGYFFGKRCDFEVPSHDIKDLNASEEERAST